MMRMSFVVTVLTAAASVGGVGCTDADEPVPDPCAAPGACADPDPTRAVVVVEATCGDDVAPSFIAAGGASRFALFEADGVTPFAAPFEVVIEPTTFSATRLAGSVVEVVAPAVVAGAMAKVSVRTPRGHDHGSFEVWAAPVVEATIGNTIEVLPLDARVALSPGVPADLVVELHGDGGNRLADHHMTVSATNVVAVTSTGWDLLTVTPPSSGEVVVEAVRGSRTWRVPLPVGTAPDHLALDSTYVLAGRAGSLCATAITGDGRAVLGLPWTWQVLGPATFEPWRPNCIWVTGQAVGTLAVTAAVPGLSQTFTVEVRNVSN